jgi:hypothetical protein
MADPESLVGQIESGNKESENDESSGSYESPHPLIHILNQKGSDLLAHRMRITYQKKRHTVRP